MVDYSFLSHLRDVGERVHQLIIPAAEPVVVAILGFWDDAPRLVGVAAGHGDAREYALYPELRPDGLRSPVEVWLAWAPPSPSTASVVSLLRSPFLTSSSSGQRSRCGASRA